MYIDKSPEQDNSFESAILTPEVVTIRKYRKDRCSKGEGSEALNTMIVVDRSEFMRDCLQRSLTDCLQGRVIGYASISEFIENGCVEEPALVLISIFSLNEEETNRELERVKNLNSGTQTMVLAKNDDLNSILTALSHGANGYISMSAGFDIFIKALRFVAVGGTYVPPQCLLEIKRSSTTAREQAPAKIFTARETAVVEAVRNGKTNKAIAYELRMCESTVKVHVRNIMKKLKVHNRTELAIKANKME